MRQRLERAVILSPGPELVVAAELFPAPASAPPPPAPPGSGAAAPAAMYDVERQHITAVLRQTRWRIESPHGAARLLNVNPSTLRSRIKKLGIRRSDDAG